MITVLGYLADHPWEVIAVVLVLGVVLPAVWSRKQERRAAAAGLVDRLLAATTEIVNLLISRRGRGDISPGGIPRRRSGDADAIQDGLDLPVSEVGNGLPAGAEQQLVRPARDGGHVVDASHEPCLLQHEHTDGDEGTNR